MSDEYNIAWDKHSEHQQLMLKELHENVKHSDVTLVCGDKSRFEAHKIVLSACSPVLKRIIENHPSEHPHPLIYLCGIQRYEMESILQLMYLGEGKFNDEGIEEIVKLAKALEMKEISMGNIEEDVTEETGGMDDDDEDKGLFEDYEAKQKPVKRFRGLPVTKDREIKDKATEVPNVQEEEETEDQGCVDDDDDHDQEENWIRSVHWQLPQELILARPLPPSTPPTLTLAT